MRNLTNGDLPVIGGGEDPFEKGCKMVKKWKIRIPRRKTEYRKLEQKWK